MIDNFTDFSKAVSLQFDKMHKDEILFVVDIDKDEIWNVYLSSFAEGTNPMYKERTEHDCQCCKQFIRALGGVVAFKGNKVVSIWDVDVEAPYKVVADALSEYVKSKAVKDVFFTTERKIGNETTKQMLENGTINWNHFYAHMPSQVIKCGDDIPTLRGRIRTAKEVFERACNEITDEAIETVVELIKQNSIYRGSEHLGLVESFDKFKKDYGKKRGDIAKQAILWDVGVTGGALASIRNSVIGTLLTDISDGVELDRAVASFEAKVAPTNYKRPTALITKGMIEKAQKKLDELGMTNSIERRFAVIDDLTINNVLFADRSAKKSMNVFDDMMAEAKTSKKTFDKVEEVSIDNFMDNILPNADTVELMLENKHIGNLVSLIAPVHNSPTMFKWGNNFSWAYNGDVTDSIKERVKNAGGNINAYLRCSLSWYNYDDLDIHVKEPNGNHIYYGSKRNYMTTGNLDVDMNAGGGNTREAVENIVWTDPNKMNEGVYTLYVNNYTKRENKDVGFEIEIEHDGNMYNFEYANAVPNGKNVEVCKFKFSRKDGFEIIESIPSTQSAKEVWDIKTNTFVNVYTIMNSPNHWDGEGVGNKHWFFMLEGCKNDGTPRGFFNEFLNENLNEHRKVFEVLGSKMAVPSSKNQLSGVGFSSTVRNSVICRVTGNFTRTIKIVF